MRDFYRTAVFLLLETGQQRLLDAALARVKKDKFAGAVILAVHHPRNTFGKHATFMVMLKEIDAICSQIGVWPTRCRAQSL